ncbi:MAG: DUF2505 family protein [Leptospiraceae bacterium]|nr:DUF2505 family protein [Leptospiraceae bacterium]MCP5494846.1 DUF2505 family protein [Leptospiraceae bacterium]
MNYKVTHTFNFPLSELLRAREDRYKNLDKFPDLRNVTLVEERKEGKNIFQKRKIGMSANLPPVLSAMLEEAVLIEESVFDTETNTHSFKLFPPGNEKIVMIKGNSVYKAISDTSSERVYDVNIKSEVFLVSGVIETTIESFHKLSLEKDKNSILKFLSENSSS